MALRFGRDARIQDRKAFQRVFAAGRRVGGRNLTLWCVESRSSGPARLGLSIGVKAGPAVRRNRLKRLAREAFRLSRARLAAGTDLVICIRPGCAWLNLADARADLLEACRKGRLLASA